MQTLNEIPIEVLERYKEKWLKVGMNTEPVDLPRAKEAAKLAYELAGYVCPDTFFVCDSPIQGVVFAYLCLQDRENEIEPYLALTPEERYQACREFIRQNADVDFSDAFNSFAFGNHDVAWLAYYEVLEKEGGVEYCSKLRGLQELAHHCGWWSPFDRAVIFQHRPCEIHLEGREAHNDSGPAIVYPDGYKLWAIHGVTLPPDRAEVIVMRPHEQTLEEICNEPNIEVKRIRIERFGWDNFLQKMGAKVVDMSSNVIENTEEALVECQMGSETVRVLIGACPSTARLYFMEVPPETKNCFDAQAYLSSGLNGNMAGAS